MADLINIKFPDGKSTKIEKGLNEDIIKLISQKKRRAKVSSRF